MATLVSCPEHNMVACLEKTKRNAQFHEIVDFLTRSSIYYSLNVSPTVSTSLIEQFWNTTTSKTVNDVSYIKAKVAGKTILISEASIRRNLLFNDVDGIVGGLHFWSLPDTTQVPRDSLEGTDRSKGDQVLHNTCTLLSQQVLDLQKPKDAQAAEIFKLKKRIKKLEKKLGKKESISKQGRKNAKSKPTLDAFDDLDANLAHVIAKDKGSGKKRGSTVSTARPEVDTARPDIDTARPEVHTANAPVSTAGVTISTADPEVSVVEPRTPPTTSIFDDEDITMAQTLIMMKEEKAKEKGVAFKYIEDSSRHVRSITTLRPLPSIDPKHKGKGILVEEEPIKIKRKDQGIDQIERDEELTHKLHEEELAEIARIQEEKVAHEEASRVAIMEMFDEVQAGIDADALFAAKLQQEEREEYTIEESVKFLAETIAAQRKFRAA
ncbi:hypothetical protein Tco_0966461 [Tanacetum coccineum]